MTLQFCIIICATNMLYTVANTHSLHSLGLWRLGCARATREQSAAERLVTLHDGYALNSWSFFVPTYSLLACLCLSLVCPVGVISFVRVVHADGGGQAGACGGRERASVRAGCEAATQPARTRSSLDSVVVRVN